MQITGANSEHKRSEI